MIQYLRIRDRVMIVVFLHRYRLTNGSEVSLEAEQWVKLPAPMEKVIVHVRGGAILPTHHHCRTTTTSCRKQPLSLLVYLDERHEASGELFWDDGDRADVLDGAGKYTHITFRLSKRGVLENFPLKSNYADVPVLSLLYVVGGGQPHSVLVNGKSWMFEYDKELRVLALVDLQLNLLQNFKVIFVFWSADYYFESTSIWSFAYRIYNRCLGGFPDMP